MLRNAQPSAVLTVSIDTPHLSTTDAHALPAGPRASKAAFRAQLASLLDVFDPFQHAGELAPLASY